MTERYQMGLYSFLMYKIIVKTKAYSYALYVYMSAQPLPIGASGMGIDVTKITLLSWKPLGLAGKV